MCIISSRNSFYGISLDIRIFQESCLDVEISFLFDLEFIFLKMLSINKSK